MDAQNEWASLLAARLKDMYAHAGDEPAARRQEYVRDMVNRELRKVPVPQRAAHLQALSQHFPTWQVPAGKAKTPEETLREVPKEMLLKRFLELWPDYDKKTQRLVVDRVAPPDVVRERFLETAALLDPRTRLETVRRICADHELAKWLVDNLNSLLDQNAKMQTVRQLLTVEVFFEVLPDLLGDLDETARATLLDELQRAGLEVGGGGPEVSEAALGYLMGVLQQNQVTMPGRQINHDRVFETAGLLADALLNIDKVLWSGWIMLTGGTHIKKAQPLEMALGYFLSGHEGVPRAKLQVLLKTELTIVAALLSAMGRANHNFAIDLNSDLAPDIIQDNVSNAKKGLFGKKVEELCWEEYIRRFSERYIPDELEKRLKAYQSRAADDFVRTGPGAPQSQSQNQGQGLASGAASG